MSQEALAEATALDRKTVNRLETGAIRAELDWVYSLSAALDQPVSQLLPERTGPGGVSSLSQAPAHTLLANWAAGDSEAAVWLAAALRVRVAELGMSQEQVGALLGVRRDRVSRLLSGSANPTLRTLARIAEPLQLGFALQRLPTDADAPGSPRYR